MFFENEENARVLGNYLRKADAAHVEDEVRHWRLSASREIISRIYKTPAEWDERCTFNITHIGDQYIRWLSEFDASEASQIDHIYVMSYRFLCEFDFLVGPGKELSMELRSIKDKIQHDVKGMDDDVKAQIVYASYIMPASITKRFVNDANIAVFKEFEKRKSEAESLKEKWDEEIKAKEVAVQGLKTKLEEYKVGFNFVGLYQGFSNLAERKEKEAFWLLLALIGMGVLILSPLVGEAIFIGSGLLRGEAFTTGHLLMLIPVISIELILIYFFRVILLAHRSVKSQIVQIDLRKSLCQFIQSYTAYSSEMKKSDSSALEKFESLIFSSVHSDPEKIPSTFDGLEQLAGLIKSIKKS